MRGDEPVCHCDLNWSDLGDSQLRQLMDGIPNISGFNYRIGRHKVGDHAYYRIHGCFYDENGEVVFSGESSRHGEFADALIADLERCSLTQNGLETTFLTFLQIKSK